MPFIVEIEKSCWLAKGKGDPARTLLRANAQEFKTLGAAKAALTRARQFHDFELAEIFDTDEEREDRFDPNKRSLMEMVSDQWNLYVRLDKAAETGSSLELNFDEVQTLLMGVDFQQFRNFASEAEAMEYFSRPVSWEY